MIAPRNKGIGNDCCRTDFLITACLLLPLLAGCESDSKLESGRQILARVNGDVITVRDFNDQFSDIASRPGLDGKVGKKKVLDALVDEKLLVQRASESGLDREPETIAALDRAKRQVLAQAVIDRATGGGRVNYRETKQFYESHPELFERRKIYVFRRFDLPGGELLPSIKAELDRAETPAEVTLVLRRANIRFSDQTEIRAAEMIPKEVLKQAAEMQRGDILIFGEGRRVLLMQLMRSIADPVALDRAAPAIRAYLSDGKRKNAADFLLRDLRKSARIEYSEGLIDGFRVQAASRTLAASESVPAREVVSQASAASASR